MGDRLQDLLTLQKLAGSRLENTGLTVNEISQLLDVGRLKEALNPIVGKVGDPTALVANRDISGHIHTTGAA